jgi:pimeloyl-ACP methyl ester carboxylesterase
MARSSGSTVGPSEDQGAHQGSPRARRPAPSVGAASRRGALKLIGPLTDPTAHGASASDAFHVVIPSMPGYGFSGKPTGTGWDPVHIGKAYVALMKRLGYTRFVAQGGDWGAAAPSVKGPCKPLETTTAD